MPEYFPLGETTPPSTDTYNPSQNGVKYTKEFRVLRSEFGDGYAQRVVDGTNVSRETFSLSWVGFPINLIEIMTTFLDEKKGADTFIWHEPLTQTNHVVTCERYDLTPIGVAQAITLTAVFRQEF